MNKKILAGLVLLAGGVRADISSNKFDVQALAWHKGISGWSSFGEEQPKKKGFMSAVCSVSMFINEGNSSWNDKSVRQSDVANAGGQVDQNYNYGVLEEHGFWDAFGLFYGFSGDEFLAHNYTSPDYTALPISTSYKDYSAVAFFAPKGYKLLPDGLKIFPTSPLTPPPGFHHEDGVGILPPSAAGLILEDDWQKEGKYDHFYQAFLKSGFDSLDFDEVAKVGNMTTDATTAGKKDAGTPYHGTTVTALPDPAKLKANLVPGGYDYKSGERRNGQLLLLPNIKKRGARFSGKATIYDGVSVSGRIGMATIQVFPTKKDPVDSQNAHEIVKDFNLLESAANDLGLSFVDYEHTGLEDGFINIVAGQGLKITDDDGDLILKLYPYVTGGVWFPSSKKYADLNANRYAFYVPLGNEGHTGWTLGGGVSFDFKDMFCLTAGAGATIFNDITIKDFRMPNNRHQIGIYPFTLDIKRKKGHVYYAHASLKSVSSDDGTGFYVDFLFAKHKPDEIVPVGTTVRNNAFINGGGVDVAIKRSSWNVAELNAGINLAFSSTVQGGFGFSTNVKGLAVPRMRTFFGNATFIF